jgi:membrane-bound ClpP family serine protease
MAGRIVKLLTAAAVAGLVATLGTFALNFAWNAIGGGTMSIHGWVALGLGLFGTVSLAWVLMALAFSSDRDGWDAHVDDRVEPGPDRDPADDL